MKYPPKMYAQALANAATAPGADQEKISRNFLALVRKNGDGTSLPKILRDAERLLRTREGRRKVTLETARPLSAELRKKLHGILKKDDVIEEKVEPSIVAGVRIVINDEEQFDATLGRKLRKMFT